MAESTKGGSGGSDGQHRGGSQPEYSPNDDRANVKNGNHPSYDADQANRKTQSGGGTGS